MQSSTWNLESTAWNPESSTALDSLTWRESDVKLTEKKKNEIAISEGIFQTE